MNDTLLADSLRDPNVGRVLGGRYRIVEPLGSGGMGVVYRAEHVHMRKPVAIKILHKHMTVLPEIVTRFEREAVAAARIEHPNVAAATDFGKLEDGSFYLALEFVEGRSLSSLLQAGPLPIARAMLIARQIADGLAAAHAAGIVHRDLKPDNVMLVDREGFPDFVKMLDFGIAKVHMGDGAATQQPLTAIGTIFGTPQYMSPEQGQGHNVDARSDLYALGVMLYEMLAGKLPFDHEDLVVLITRHITEPPPPLPSSIPSGVRELVFDLLEKDPDKRISSAAALVKRIDRLFTDTSILPPGTMPPSGFPSKRSDSTQAPPRPRVRSLFARAERRVSAVVTLLGERAPVLRRRVRAGRINLPLGGVLFGGAFLLGFASVVIIASSSESGGTRAGSAAQGASAAPAVAAAPDPALVRHQKLIAAAETGDAEALRALDAMAVRERKLEGARALGHGRCASGAAAECVVAYKAAVLAFGALRRDPVLLRDVRATLEHAEAYEDAMRLAAHQLGPSGIDLLYDMWWATRGDKDPAAQRRRSRARAFLDDPSVRASASRELQLVLELERAEKRQRCSEVKPLLPKAIEYGDQRLTPVLERFSSTRGCGFVGLGDCWGCLRGGKDLARARDAVKDRKVQ